MIKTTFLLGSLTGILISAGYMIGGTPYAFLALGIASVMNLYMFWNSDKLILKMYDAKQVGPDTSPALYDMVERLAKKANMPMPKVYIMQNNTPNAFATGRIPKHGAVAATTGIMRLLSNEELEGVMAHELAHVKNRDTLISTMAAIIGGALSILGRMMMFGGNRGKGGNMQAIGALLMMVLAPLIATLIKMAISRSREYIADEIGARICGKPNALASALERLQS